MASYKEDHNVGAKLHFRVIIRPQNQDIVFAFAFDVEEGLCR